MQSYEILSVCRSQIDDEIADIIKGARQQQDDRSAVPYPAEKRFRLHRTLARQLSDSPTNRTKVGRHPPTDHRTKRAIS